MWKLEDDDLKGIRTRFMQLFSFLLLSMQKMYENVILKNSGDFSKNKDVAERCLIDGTSYDSNYFKIVKIYPINGLRTEAKSFSFEIDVTELERNRKSILFQA